MTEQRLNRRESNGGRAPHPATASRSSAAQPKSSKPARAPHAATVSREGAASDAAPAPAATTLQTRRQQPHPAARPKATSARAASADRDASAAVFNVGVLVGAAGPQLSRVTKAFLEAGYPAGAWQAVAAQALAGSPFGAKRVAGGGNGGDRVDRAELQRMAAFLIEWAAAHPAERAKRR